MKLPRKTASIDGRRIHLRVVDQAFDSGGKPARGTWEGNRRIIEITRDDDNLMRDTLLHEVLHALDDTLSERQVLNLERALFAFRTHNAAVWRWIFDRE